MARSSTTWLLIIVCCVATAGFAGKAIAQWGNNAPPYSNCPCIPACPWGYYPTHWHQWPCASASKTPGSQGAGEIPPSQIDLPNPRSEAEVKTPSPARAPLSEMPAPVPESQRGGSTPSIPLPEPGTESSPEKTPSMELPGTEVPKEPPSLPESMTPKSESPAPSAEKSSPSPTPDAGASTSPPRLKFRGNAMSAGFDEDLDPPPVNERLCRPHTEQVAIGARKHTVEVPRVSAAPHPAVSASEPQLISPSATMRRLEPGERDTQTVQATGENPLRIGAVQQTAWSAAELKRPDATQPTTGETFSLFNGSNPLRRN
jgi:hypothetical protein